jgi:hypothetical protein
MKNWNSYRLVYQSVFSSKIHINTHEPYKKWIYCHRWWIIYLECWKGPIRRNN